jgi:hypothetical protein
MKNIEIFGVYLLVICATLSACHSLQNSQRQRYASARNDADEAIYGGVLSEVDGLRKLSAPEIKDMVEYYPLHHYSTYPPDIRVFLQREYFEHDLCRIAPGADGSNGPRAMRSCNASFHMMIALEDKGWCWGGSTTESEKRWVRCRDTVESGYMLADREPFSPAEIQQAEREAQVAASSAAQN